MKLNFEKCAIWVQSSKFVGFMITQRSIEANPEKVQTILDMASLKTPHDVQKLTCRLAALSKFLVQSGDKYHPFFKALKGARNFKWIGESEATFKAIKDHFYLLPTVAKAHGFALIIASRKFRPYFMAHSIIVSIDKPLEQVLKCPDASGRMIKWTMKLGQFNVDYALRATIKAQALVDFISKATGSTEDEPKA
ncbi:hypothetical protein CRG98_007112 [Punica granatum]|uniref:Reverse transcriptase RNase H-like domain-containing protein n=1 Tax=Punica granatum TaxID=22663 RepID=A0A2I0KVL1_PUNGR|nr:hypothetical protein CRG98_007112 [Punica granatum]